MHISSKLKTSIAAALALSTCGAIGILPAKAEPEPCGSHCHAPVPGETTGTSSDETVGFLGLRWNFGEKSPALTAGVRYTHTDLDDKVLGLKFDASVGLKPDFTFTPVVRLLGVAGNRTIQGELGLGVDTADWQALVSGGVQIPNLSAGVNATFAGAVTPFIETSSLGRPAAPVLVQGWPSCLSFGDPYPVINGVADIDGKYQYYVDPSVVVQGYTCITYE